MDAGHKAKPATLLVLVAFGVIYFVWGSTYLFIKFGIETIPPMVLAGARHTLAGGALLVWLMAREGVKLSGANWGAAAVLGGLMLVGGNGGVTWAQQFVPSGITALIVATVPMWMTLLDWLRPRGRRPPGQVLAGLLLGFGGIALLIGPGRLGGTDRIESAGAAVLLGAALSWAAGSLLARHLKVASSLLLATALQSIAGGALLLVLAWPAGHWARLDVHAVSWKSLGALLYLATFGSAVGFSSYLWLLRVTTAARVSTYAYVNPLVALALGWLAGGENVGGRSLAAAGVIIAAVALIVSHREKAAVAEGSPAEKVETADLGCAGASGERSPAG
jgi:drug/metabolite transporter (DMT)-like permease